MKIAICDDDPQFCTLLFNFIDSLACTGFQFECFIFEDGEQLLSAFHEQGHPFDLILLDVKMPLLNGINTAHEIRAIDQAVIIVYVTGYPEYSLEASRVQPFYFIGKPITDYQQFSEDFLTACHACRHRQEDCLLLDTKRFRYIIPHKDLIYIEVTNKQVTVIAKDRQPISIWSSLHYFKQVLDFDSFFQPHRAFIVRLDMVKQIDVANRMALMANGDKIPISEHLLKKFWAAIVKQKKATRHDYGFKKLL